MGGGRRIRFIGVIGSCLGLVFLLISCSRDSEEEERNPEAVLDYSPIELELLDLVNEHRVSASYNELRKLDEISHQSLLHNEHMIKEGEVCHHNSGARFNVLSKSVGAKTMGENVGYGYRTAEAFLNAWIKSPEHKKILTGNHTHFGISAQQAKEKLYVTLIFIRR